MLENAAALTASPLNPPRVYTDGITYIHLYSPEAAAEHEEKIK